MSEAQEVLERARERAERVRSMPRPTPDYANVNTAFRKQKARLTRAINSGDKDKVVLACRDAVREWRQAPFNGFWPDDWHRWNIALQDAVGIFSGIELEDLD